MLDPTSLFAGAKITLTAPQPEADAEIEASWTNDPDFLALVQSQPVRPLTASQILKSNPSDEKSERRFTFAIRLNTDQRMVGRVDLYDLMPWNGLGSLSIRIGKPEDRGKGYGKEALALVLRYAFHELNLHRLSAWVLGYNLTAQHFFASAGFSVEVRQREALLRFGRRWDYLLLGLLKNEWEARLVGHSGGEA